MIRKSTPEFTITEITDPEFLAQSRARDERFERNWAWMEAHAEDVFANRGKVICVAGEELFVADNTKEVLAKAKAAHPDDDGRFTLIIPLTRAPRVYANQRLLASLG